MVPQVGAGAHASIDAMGSQAGRLSKATPPLQEVPVLQPYIHAGSNVTADAKLEPPPGQTCPLVTIVHNKNIIETTGTMDFTGTGLLGYLKIYLNV